MQLVDYTDQLPTLLSLDPPRHTEMRRRVLHAFTPKVVRELEPRMRAIVRATFDRVAALGTCDFVQDVVRPLPLEIVCDILGVPAEDRARVGAWADLLAGSADPEIAREGKTGTQGAIEFGTYAFQLAQKSEPAQRRDADRGAEERRARRRAGRPDHVLRAVRADRDRGQRDHALDAGRRHARADPQSRRAARAAARPDADPGGGRGDAALALARALLPAHRHARHRAARPEDRRRRPRGDDVRVRESRRGRVPQAPTASTSRARRTRTSRSASASTSVSAPRSAGSRRACSSRSSSRASRRSSSRASPCACARTSSTPGSGCRCGWSRAERASPGVDAGPLLARARRGRRRRAQRARDPAARVGRIDHVVDLEVRRGVDAPCRARTCARPSRRRAPCAPPGPRSPRARCGSRASPRPRGPCRRTRRSATRP